ncbi:DUF6199 family natural product biosynthesis protein [Gottfriedia acidiceleris]|uniref:DUF6199 family natural product biosynthesis protein n=1 Tax=Gottfriedia acidiceleris TaxID=371036 RepID=UPI0014312845|nr:DUF6199 family natural product biosynthesis protein [Gottfriedia acidiceleris]
MFIGILLLIFGVFLIVNPEAFWVVTESWISDGQQNHLLFINGANALEEQCAFSWHY